MSETGPAPYEIRGNRLYADGNRQIARPEAVGTGLALYRTRKGWGGSWRNGVLEIPEEMARLIFKVERAIAVDRQAAVWFPASEPKPIMAA